MAASIVTKHVNGYYQILPNTKHVKGYNSYDQKYTLKIFFLFMELRHEIELQ